MFLARLVVDYFSLYLVMALAGIAGLIWTLKSRMSIPTLFFSVPQFFASDKQTKKESLQPLTCYLLITTFFIWMLALLDPHFAELSTKQNRFLPTQGVALYLILDQSGSMGQSVGDKAIRKMDLMKKITTQFIQERPGDLIGLVTFARGAEVLAPLTWDRDALLDELQKLDLVADREQDGTAIGYAIFKTANLISATRHFAEEQNVSGKKPYDIKSAVMVLVTDGFQDPNPLDKGKRLRNLDVDEAAAYAKKENIKLYIVNVEPSLATEKFAPHRRLMQRSAELTGGKFFFVDKGHTLEDIYAEINQLEKSEVPFQDSSIKPVYQRTFSLYPYLIVIGLLCLFSSFLLKTTWLRKIP